MIEIKNLHKRFDGETVLNGVNLTISDGDTLVIIGKSGCGKTVLLKHLIGLLKPDEGEIRIDGIDITKVRRKKLYEMRKKFGMLFQSGALFDSMTVGENIGLPLREHTRLSDEDIRRVVEEKLRLVGLEQIENLRPAELSGGMKKRVALARALVMEPLYILFDEPTTGVDPVMADKINDLIIEIQKKLKTTSITVTHDIASAFKIGNTFAMLADGKIIFKGTEKELKENRDPRVKEFLKSSGTFRRRFRRINKGKV